MSASREDLIATLDVGSSKVACFIGQIDDVGTIKVLGMGVRMCRGVKSGVVVDMEETEHAIRAAVEQAERIAGETIDSVTASLSGGEPESAVFEVEVAIDGHRVDQGDIARVLEQARSSIPEGERTIVHAFPACYALDGVYGVRAPVGMYGESLAVTMHVISALPGPVRNLEAAIERAHLSVSGFVASPYAAGLAALVEDERELGAACIDLGGGTTQIGIFAAGALVHAEVVEMGGQLVTQDIARGLLTPVDCAERLKTLHGSAVASPSDDRETIEAPQLGESAAEDGGESGLPRSMLNGIIQPRLEELFEIVRDRLATAGFETGGSGGGRVVLTGGAAQLPGIRDLAQRVLGTRVRIGRPVGFPGLAEATAGPAFSTCAGLLRYRIAAPSEARSGQRRPDRKSEPNGRLGRVGRWLKENF